MLWKITMKFGCTISKFQSLSKTIQIFRPNLNFRIDEAKSYLKEDLFAPIYENDKSHKIQCDFMKSLTKVMAGFEWKQHQHFLNTFKQYRWHIYERFNESYNFRTQIEGLQVHFVRMSTSTSTGKKLVPLLLLHGFPGSHWDFFKVRKS